MSFSHIRFSSFFLSAKTYEGWTSGWWWTRMSLHTKCHMLHSLIGNLSHYFLLLLWSCRKGCYGRRRSWTSWSMLSRYMPGRDANPFQDIMHIVRSLTQNFACVLPIFKLHFYFTVSMTLRKKIKIENWRNKFACASQKVFFIFFGILPFITQVWLCCDLGSTSSPSSAGELGRCWRAGVRYKCDGINPFWKFTGKWYFFN